MQKSSVVKWIFGAPDGVFQFDERFSITCEKCEESSDEFCQVYEVQYIVERANLAIQTRNKINVTYTISRDGVSRDIRLLGSPIYNQQGFIGYNILVELS